MHILVVGGSGRVGRCLVSQLVKAGHKVTVFDQTPPDVPGVGYSAVRLEVFKEVKDALDCISKPNAVVHLAALMSWKDSDAVKLFDVNVKGTFNLLEGVKGYELQRFVFASSGEVYPERRPAYLPIDEKHPTKPISYYGVSKLLGEKLVWFYARKFGLPAVVLRFSHTQDAIELLDPNSRFSGPRFFLQAKIKAEQEMGNVEALARLKAFDDSTEKLVLSRGNDGMPYMMPIADTRDIVQGIILALEKPEAVGEVFNIGPENAVSFDEIIPMMQKFTGLPVVEVRLPGPAVYYHTSIQKAKDRLGFKPRWDFKSMLEEAHHVLTHSTRKGSTDAGLYGTPNPEKSRANTN